MEYMESKMQDLYDAGEHRMQELYKEQLRFAEFCLTIPDFDESLLEDVKDDGFRYNNPNVDLMWFVFKAGAGV